MKVSQNINSRAPRAARRQAGFSLTEVTVGMSVIGMSVVALFSGLTNGFFSVQMARENLRATQILIEKMETLRLYSWDQINTSNFIPAAFTAPYDPNSTNQGVTYQGSVSITNAPVASSYSNDMRMVTVTLNWTTGNLNRSRQLTTYVARNGLQTYIY